jgi:hypothetical protein
MKKIIALLLCACVLLLAGCGGADDSAETTVAAPEGYVGEGLLTSLKVLVYSNEYFVNDVFINGSLPVSYDKSIEKESHVYYRVTAENFTDYASLESAVLSTYTEQAAEKLLKSSKYAQIDGVFCVDAFLLNQSAPAPEWDIESASARMISDDECELKVPVTRTDSTKSEVTLTAVKVDGSWRLNDIYEG